MLNECQVTLSLLLFSLLLPSLPLPDPSLTHHLYLVFIVSPSLLIIRSKNLIQVHPRPTCLALKPNHLPMQINLHMIITALIVHVHAPLIPRLLNKIRLEPGVGEAALHPLPRCVLAPYPATVRGVADGPAFRGNGVFARVWDDVPVVNVFAVVDFGVG